MDRDTQEIKYSYAGSTKHIEKRFKQHYKNSHNKRLKYYIELAELYEMCRLSTT